VPTLEQVRHVLRSMPAATAIERRDRAIIAFAILTGARDGAIASMKLKHVDLDQQLVEHDVRRSAIAQQAAVLATRAPRFM
jgi:integrase